MEGNNTEARTKIRSAEEYQKLVNRLNRIEGQIRGIKGMLERSAYCADVLTQVAAVNAALNAFSRELLAGHISSCVVNDIKAGKNGTAEELIELINKIMK